VPFGGQSVPLEDRRLGDSAAIDRTARPAPSPLSDGGGSASDRVKLTGAAFAAPLAGCWGVLVVPLTPVPFPASSAR